MIGSACRGIARGRPTHIVLAATAFVTSASGLAAQVTVRADHPDLSYPALESMSPAALGDALLSPGHPAIVSAKRLFEGMSPPPPPGSPIRFQVRLIAAAQFDAASGFCVRRSWAVTTMIPRPTSPPDRIEPRTDYALGGRCTVPGRSFFHVDPDDRPRAFTIVRLFAAAVAAAKTRAPRVPITLDDQEGARATRYLRTKQPPDIVPIAVFANPREALASLPPGAIGYVGHRLAGADLLAPARLHDAAGRPRERWQLHMDGDWTVDLVLDGDAIAAIALRRRVPPPF